jgi:hypothetical protein
MNFKRKLVFFEGEMTEGKGHYLDNLVETTIFFKEKFNIIWFVNKNFITFINLFFFINF